MGRTLALNGPLSAAGGSGSGLPGILSASIPGASGSSMNWSAFAPSPTGAEIGAGVFAASAIGFAALEGASFSAGPPGWVAATAELWIDSGEIKQPKEKGNRV